MISLRHSKFSPTETKGPTMMSYSADSTPLKMLIPPSTNSSMSMASLTRQSNSFSTNTTPIPWTATILPSVSQETQLLMTSRMHTGSLLWSIILRRIPMMKPHTRNSLRSMRPTMPSPISSKDPTTTTSSSNRLHQLEHIISSMTSSQIVALALATLLNSDQFSNQSGQNN